MSDQTRVRFHQSTREPYRLGPQGEAERHRRMMLRNHANREHDGRNARHDCPACRRFSPIFNQDPTREGTRR
jgi:hypothetical protein